MSDDVVLGVRQACELEDAFRLNRYRTRGWTNEKIRRLCESGLLLKVLDVIDGFAEIRLTDFTIDSDADPFILRGFKLEKHIKGGIFKFDPAKTLLYLSEKQKSGVVDGNDFRRELADKPVLNANVSEYLVAHQELIPKEWMGKLIFFFGTVYRDADGNPYVYFLHWFSRQWERNLCCLNRDFNSDNPAIIAG
jgi:hypothetical protein